MTHGRIRAGQALAEELPLPVDAGAPAPPRGDARRRPASTCARTLQRMARQPHTLLPRYTRPRAELPTLVVLLDISGSMDR